MDGMERNGSEEPRVTSGGAPGVSLLGSLVIVARQHGIHLSAPQLVHDHLLEPGQPSIPQLLQIAGASGLRASSTWLSWSELTKLGKALPAVVILRNGSAMVLRQTNQDPQLPRVILQDPNAHEDAPLILDEARFTAAWTGEVLLFKRDYRIRDEDQPFGLKLILGVLVRDKRIARDIAIAAFMLSLLALAPILFWRLLIDRVLYYNSISTFSVLCLSMLILIAFETAFGYLRRYLVLHMTQRADAKLSTYIFDKVVQLPVDFFERMSVGEIARDMHEIHKIRNFLTGTMFGTVLDAFVLFVFLPIMLAFSPMLTLFVLAFAGLICGWIILRLPDLRKKTKAVFEIEGEKGAFLVETLHGVRTVKALALDARRRHDWDVKVASAARLRFEEGRAANVVQTVAVPLERLMTSGVIAVAVYMAMTTHEQVYIGALFAFMMLSQRVAMPLIQLSQTIVQYDEVRLALSVIGNLVNRPSEEGRGKSGIRTPIVGRVDFSGVRFSYMGTTSPALDDVSFTIPEGSIFGIMGRSGSGKTTVTRLLQLFHGNYEGLIKVDGTDLRQYDVDHLRGSFGVVMQENFLFSGTIRETIAAGKPDATFDEVVMAARLAGAEEFIERMQRGYETYIYEGSPNLSGGQRQRLAIARALITNPRILILDEATSALDAESEAIVNANLMRIAEGRTLIIVSHRLSSLIAADSILVLERGKIYDIGAHTDLIERCDIYSNLWHQQHQHLLPRPSSHEVISFRPAGTA
ncbi:MAG TPA: peptidase domain-containing ABC transporter [Stellaceae bacterium]|nr:peptidase domain-containing ABC transporter [Stellaceae bacterium]